jgi:type II secretory pathway component PulF
VAVAEESGRLPEMCAVQAENYDEQARRRLATLNKIASVLIWLVVAAFIITAIFRIFTTTILPREPADPSLPPGVTPQMIDRLKQG